LFISASSFYLGDSSQFISGSNGALLISSSTFNLVTEKLTIDSTAPQIYAGKTGFTEDGESGF